MVTENELKEICLKYGVKFKKTKTEILLGLGSSIYWYSPNRCVEPDIIFAFELNGKGIINERYEYLRLAKEEEG